MFNADFYPTPDDVIHQMCMGVTVDGSIILEPSGGAGHIVDYLKSSGAKEVMSCEKHKDLRSILMRKCKVISDDFLTVTESDISHINMIIGNPPFSTGDQHILHAYKIAPAGCTIVMLCNYETYNNSYSATRKELRTIIDTYGSCTNIGEAFTTAERTTYTKVGLIRICRTAPDDKELVVG
jgi:16S rRNA A1518/A1519 N6-dimethyltransferase RsmA/KsgA/DIM1 with predicted DNA glycosylase/AP lyase activity